MKSLTICYITARPHPEFIWFLDSLNNQIGDMPVTVLLIDYLHNERDGGFISQIFNHPLGSIVERHPCKPNVWQGEHRKTPGQWWAVSAYRNTGICLCRTEWFAVIDDRSIIDREYLHAIRDAMTGGYAVCGRYQKRRDMTVERGFIKHAGTIIGEDPRFHKQGKMKAPGSWFFGANSAQPLEFALTVNGWDESCDSLGLEDCVYGEMLERNKFPIVYDPRMSIIEDRSAQFYEPMVRRTDKGISPKDKSHGILDRTAGKKQATHHWNLREIRQQVLSGHPFPIPTEPTHDWWDGKPLSEFP